MMIANPSPKPRAARAAYNRKMSVGLLIIDVRSLKQSLNEGDVRSATVSWHGLDISGTRGFDYRPCSRRARGGYDDCGILGQPFDDFGPSVIADLDLHSFRSMRSSCTVKTKVPWASEPIAVTGTASA